MPIYSAFFLTFLIILQIIVTAMIKIKIVIKMKTLKNSSDQLNNLPKRKLPIDRYIYLNLLSKFQWNPNKFKAGTKIV